MSNVLRVYDQLRSKGLFEAVKIQLAKDFELSNFDANSFSAEAPMCVDMCVARDSGGCFL